MGCEEVLEAAFVAWSGVVGEFFGKSNGRRSGKHDTRRLGIGAPKGRTGRRISLGFDRIPLMQSSTQRVAAEASKTERQAEKKNLQSASTRLNRNATISFSNLQAALWRRSTSGLAFLSGHGDASADTPETNGSSTKPLGALSSQNMTSLSPASISRKSRHFSLKFGSSGNDSDCKNVTDAHGKNPKSGVKIPTFQDLAIQPVQRVVRYVLLYKGEVLIVLLAIDTAFVFQILCYSTKYIFPSFGHPF